jgi:hypothetical protein
MGKNLLEARGVKIFSWEFMLGMLLAPILLGLVWCRPVEIGDFTDQKFMFLLALNTLTAYPDFAFHFAVTHLIATRSKTPSAWNYYFVICVLSIAVFVGLKFYYLHGINGLGYGGVVVLQDGSITKAGFSYLLNECLFNALGHIGAMSILWYIAFRPKVECER